MNFLVLIRKHWDCTSHLTVGWLFLTGKVCGRNGILYWKEYLVWITWYSYYSTGICLSETLTLLSNIGWSLRIMCLRLVNVTVSICKVASGYFWQLCWHLCQSIKLCSLVPPLPSILYLSCKWRLPQASSPPSPLRAGVTWLPQHHHPLVIPYASPFLSQFLHLSSLILLTMKQNMQ